MKSMGKKNVVEEKMGLLWTGWSESEGASTFLLTGRPWMARIKAQEAVWISSKLLTVILA